MFVRNIPSGLTNASSYIIGSFVDLNAWIKSYKLGHQNGSEVFA